VTFYDEIGGLATISRIVDVFYLGVAEDELLRPMYPEQELEGAKQRLTLFLAQYWGGPTTYSDTRGHPRLRMRHAPFPVTQEARERWLLHFRAGLDAVELDPEHDAMFWDYVNMAALHMVNSLD
jgi:hemoglobin